MSSNIQSRRIRGIVTNQNIQSKAPSRTNQLIDVANQFSKNSLIPMARQMTRNAIDLDSRPTYYYFKKTTGRECSCSQENNTASGVCPICFKQGIVGGFDKFGTITEILDTTLPFNSANISVNYVNRPTTFELPQDQNYGYIIWKIPLKQNIGKLDLLQIIDYREFDANIQYLIKIGGVWVDLTEQSLTSQLLTNELSIKAILSRNNSQIGTPKIVCLRIRYQIRDNLFIKADWEHPKNSQALSEYGIFNDFQTQTVNLDDTIPMVRPQDWMWRSDRNERWKIIESDKHDQLQIITGTNITVRLIQSHEIQYQYPL